MSLDKELNDTLMAVYGLKAQRPDNLEDYFHDAIVRAIEHKKPLETHLGYLYKSVYWRVACGEQEGRNYVELDEYITCDSQSPNIDLMLDMQLAMSYLTERQYDFIYKFFYEGFTLDEIAMLHDIYKSTVSQTIQRGLRTMKRVLECK